MVIDVHTHPCFFDIICEDKERVQTRRSQYGLYKSNPVSMENMITVMDHAGIDKTVLLPLDLTTVSGMEVISNEEIKKIVDLYPDRYIGFASADPHRNDALEHLEYAFKELKLSGLKLNLSRLEMMPYESGLNGIYDLCIKYNKPIMFHSGLSMEPEAPTKYAKPSEYEAVAIKYPELRFCLAHFGWPWIDETLMMILKYPNVYTDTSLLYMDSPKALYEQLFLKNMGPMWIDRNFNHKVMFGSNHPRFRAVRLKDGIESLPMHKKTMQRILGLNAVKFLGLEDK
jgi:predicted TIM-barrel fold metal-dependent hydrolase